MFNWGEVWVPSVSSGARPWGSGSETWFHRMTQRHKFAFVWQLLPQTPFSPCQNVDVSRSPSCWALTSLLIPLKHNKSYLKPGWMCRGRHSQENHFQPHLCSVSFAYLLLLTGPLWLNSISGGPYSSNRQVQPARAELGASELALSAYTLALITSIHMALFKNLGTVLGQIKFTRHSWVAPCLWGDEVTVLQALEGAGSRAANLEWPCLNDFSTSIKNISSWPIRFPALCFKTKATYKS